MSDRIEKAAMVSEETIQQAAKVIDAILSADPQIAHEMFGDEPDKIARALHQAGLLAASAVSRDEVWRVVAAHDPGDDEMALCRVNRLTDALWSLVSGADPALLAALRAVLDLHKPYPDEGMGWRDDHTYGNVGTVCGTCGTPDEYGTPWPCPTVRAINAALGEES